MKKNSINQVVATGVGAALFVILGMLVNIPLPIPNTSIQLQYALQALLAVLYGPVVGFLVGFIGHALKDAIQYGSPWWSWVIVSGAFGLILGLFSKTFKVATGIFSKADLLKFNLYQILANFIGWSLIAPSLDVLLYSEPANKVYVQGIFSAIANALVVGIGGSLLLSLYAKTRPQEGSLKTDE